MFFVVVKISEKNDNKKEKVKKQKSTEPLWFL